MQKLKIAITGGIGSGKSLFCHFLTDMGHSVLSADSIARTLMETDEALRIKIIAQFGNDSFHGTKINKDFVSKNIFSDKNKLAFLNSIVHPAVISHSVNLLNKELETRDIVFYESALIFEAGIKANFDKVVLIYSDEAIRVNRIIERDGLNSEEINKRILSQMNEDKKAELADIVIHNSGTKEDLRKSAADLLKSLLNN